MAWGSSYDGAPDVSWRILLLPMGVKVAPVNFAPLLLSETPYSVELSRSLPALLLLESVFPLFSLDGRGCVVVDSYEGVKIAPQQLQE